MADNTDIEWTDATWNPITGCSIVSPGCTNCYAMALAGTRLKNHESRKGLTKQVNGKHVWTGEVRFNAEWLDQPLRWTKPRMIFVCAHGDLFAEGVPDEWIDQIFAVMALAPQHTFQVLTKRPERMRKYLQSISKAGLYGRQMEMRSAVRAISPVKNSIAEAEAVMRVSGARESGTWAPLHNVWLGVSVEDQRRADERIPILLDTPAAIRWISAEPLLGPVDISRWTATAHVTCKACRNAFWLHSADPCRHKDEGDGWTLACPHCGGCRCKPAWSEMDARCGTVMEPPQDWMDREIGRFTKVHPTIQVKSGLDWVVAGGESGPDARPMHPDWARVLRDQCAAAGVPFLLKQWGEWAPRGPESLGYPLVENVPCLRLTDRGGNGSDLAADGGNHVWMQRSGKRLAGRLFDGVEHNAFPTTPQREEAR
jgi:protein gp37